MLSTYGRGNHAVVSERYRYISNADGSKELYDMIDDPNEWTNLADDAGYADVIEELATHLPEYDAPDLAQPAAGN